MLKQNEARDKIIDMAMAEIVLKRVGQPEDLANVIAFFASDKAKHVTGECVKVDGGQYI
jgi:3-oxoacyl-[acyl-carrier protein] reductase